MTKDWLLARIKEPSTWAGLAAVIGGMAFIPAAASIAASIPVIGAAVAGLVAIWLPENK